MTSTPGVTDAPGTGAPASVPGHLGSLLRHFGDLRDGLHGDQGTRQGKERLFVTAVELLGPYAEQALREVNEHLLRNTGEIRASGVRRTPDGGVAATWALTWPEQRVTEIDPITIRAHYGGGFHHPHLSGATVGEWPLNVFDAGQAAAELPLLRAIVAADLHNLVFQRDFRIVPATVAEGGPLRPGAVLNPRTKGLPV
ncbi:hypothetical protein [Streptomyces sp. NRRL S-118]|uniref:hypothetical protein n=1 Tax=Streptomyces sp. NRRL S-118 TaxID=1463881 RepID=UPI000694BC2C|nr:hypothetical protein [Streptomyces sp. NRRL S-118]